MSQIRVAFQGARGAFSELACRQVLDNADLAFVPCERFFQVYEALAEGRVDFGVIPIENTLHGSVHENYDHLLRDRPAILAETHVRVVHNLIGRPEASLDQITRAISHPVALAQCVEFFRRRPGILAESHYDTGGSVKTVMDGSDASLGAVASSAAAAYYGAKILVPEIEDDRENYTRFFLLAREPVPAKPAGTTTKTTIVFVTANVPGALFKCMSAFALREINLTKIESRPLKGRPYEYRFYVDVLASPDEPTCANALRHLEELTEFTAVLGSYRPASVAQGSRTPPAA